MNQGNNNTRFSYARPIATHVSPPIGLMQQVMQENEQRYYQNLDNTNQLRVALNNMQVDEKDQHIKEEAVQKLESAYNSVAEKGDWENASMFIRNATVDVATNSGLNAALMRRKDRMAKTAALEERIGKKPEEGGITRTDYEREVARAAQNDTGTVFNPETKQWNTAYNIYTPPAYINLGEETDKFLKEWQPDKLLGTLVKKADGKWYKANPEFVKTPDNAYWLEKTTELADYAEVYQAAKDQLMQNQYVRERLKYDVGNQSDLTYEKMAAAGFNREAMVDNLKKLGEGDATTFKNMSNEEVLKVYKEAMVLHEGVKGAVSKHAFMREDLDVLGETWDMKVKLAKTAKAGTEENVKTYQILDQFMLQNYKVDTPVTVEEYNLLNKTLDQQITSEQSTINDYTRTLEKDPLWKDYIAGTIDEATFKAKVQNTPAYENLMAAKVRLAAAEDRKFINQQFYQRALTAIAKETGKPMTNDVREYLELADNPDVKRVMNNESPWNFLGSDKAMIESERIKKIMTPELQAKVDRFKELKDKYEDTWTPNELSRVSKKMKEYYDNNTVSYSYTDLSNDGFGDKSDWYKQEKQNLVNNLNSYYLVNTDGKRQEFNMEESGILMNGEWLEPVGRTNQPVYGHDYGIVVREIATKTDKDGKRVASGEAPKMHIVIPTTNTDASAARAIRRVNMGYAEVKGQSKQNYILENSSELAQIWAMSTIDKQLAHFQAFENMPSNEGINSITLPIQVGAKYKANVTRQTLPNGDTVWNVAATDEQGVPLKTQNGAPSTSFRNIYEVEHALEFMAGSGYAVPLKLLRPIDNNTFENIKVGDNLKFPYLHNDFVQDLCVLDNAIPYEMRFTSGLRAPDANVKANGAESSRHMYGLGADFHLTPELEKYVMENFSPTGEAPSKRRKKTTYNQGYEETHTEDVDVTHDGDFKAIVPGTNLELLIHDAGSGRHLHVEYTKMPQALSQLRTLM